MKPSFRPDPERAQRVEGEVERPVSQPTQFRPPRRRFSPLAATALLAALTFTPPLHAQGCAQCQDNTAATSPKTQAAYRHAIILMTVTAGGLFAGTLFLFRRR